MRVLILGLAIGFAGLTAHAQRAPQSFDQANAAVSAAQAQREEVCRNEAARGITSTKEELPPGARRATSLEFELRLELCLQKAAQADEVALQTHSHYINNDGHVVHSPSRSMNGQVPAGASAKCRDGTYSFSQHHRGTCSHHGGVGSWL